MISFSDMVTIVKQIKFRDWEIRVHIPNEKGSPYLKITYLDKDTQSDKVELQHCRKWQLSYHMVPSEVIRTAYKAVCAAMEHEVDENFRYKGRLIYNPHIDLDQMAEWMIGKERISVRETNG